MLATTNGHANGHVNRLPVDPTPEEIAARAAQVRSERKEGTQTARPIAVPTEPRLTPMEEAIIEVLKNGHRMKASEIAERAGYPCSSRFRSSLAMFVHSGQLTRNEDGYALSDTKRTGPPIIEAILKAAGPVPMPSQQLATKAGYTYNSHWRKQLAELVREGHLAYGPDGYWLASATKVPPAASKPTQLSALAHSIESLLRGVSGPAAVILKALDGEIVGIRLRIGEAKSAVPAVMSPMQEAILEALAGGAMEGKMLAQRAGYAYGGQFRTASPN